MNFGFKTMTNMKTTDHNPEKTLSERLAPAGVLLLLIAIIIALFV
jgi:hypothetical protein